MNNKYCLFIILFVGAITAAGCAATTRPIVGETAYLPLNEGVKDLSFISPGEIEIFETVNKTRGSGVAAGSPQPLKISKGLSFAAKERAEELARLKNPDLTKEEERNRLFERVRKFGTWKGGVAEIASHGYPAGAEVVAELMRNSPATRQQQRQYFMNTTFTVMGVGCTSAETPAPICVITLATEFNEAR
jgi:uncharacterized protein YkwD